MTEKFKFADVALPFHVWVREGGRWILRNDAPDLQGAAGMRVEPATAGAEPRATQGL